MGDLVGQNLGPYRILEPVGLGGMATVYKAYHAAMDRYVAIKVLPQHLARDPNFRARFQREARTIARLEHPYILPVYDVGEDDGIPYLVMRYTDSGDLSDLIARQALTIARAVRLISQVAAGLAYAHRLGVIHRDVKPANVLLSREGEALLTDFGIAKIYEETLQLTGEGTLIGTPAYMAPEQLQGQTVDARTDIYALGVVLYQALTGECPFVAETPLAVALMHIHNPLRPPRQLNPAIPEALERIVLRAMAKNPADRFQTAEALAEALRDALAGLSRPTAVVPAPVAAPPAGAVAPPAVPTPPIEPAPTPAPAAPTARRGLRRVPVWAWLVSGLVVVGIGLLASGGPNPPGGLATPIPTQSAAVATGSPAAAATPIPTQTPSAQPSSTPLPTRTPSPALGPIGESQPIPKGLVYLGDKKTLALGFNMSAGGAIGSLVYNGRELVNGGTDYGRYIQLEFLDGNDKYEPLGNDPFGNWGWNPIQAGSNASKGAKVLEYRTTEHGVYIKAYGKEWGKPDVDSDVIFETWAWQRSTYFELHVRATHIGTDTHATIPQPFPSAHFATSLTQAFGYFGDTPFTAQPSDNLRQRGDGNICPPVTPTEHWVAFATGSGLGLILALPSQLYLTSDWNLCLSGDVRFTAPLAFFDNPPNGVHEATFYLIPGPIDKGRAIVYDLIPHTTWTFDLNSLEGWHNTLPQQPDTVENGILSAHLNPTGFLTSRADLRISGAIAPRVTLRARAKDSEANICLYFLAANSPYWDPDKRACVSVAPGEFQTYTLDFSRNPAWNDNVITQLGLTVLNWETTVDIDALTVEMNGRAWEFESEGDSEGWAAWYLTSLQVSNGHLTAQSPGSDPQLESPKFAVDAAAFPRIEIRMKVSSGTMAQLFFITDSDQTEDGAKSSLFSVIDDGQFHTYTLDMSEVKGWNGTITQIRLDPTDTQASVEVDYIRITRP